MLKNTLIGSLLLSGFYAFGQTTSVYTAQDVDFKDATELYHLKTYPFAQDKFQTIANNKAKSDEIREISELYFALCAIKLEQKGALARYEKIANKSNSKDYVAESYQDLGDYFYNKGDYQKALEYYDKTKPTLVKNNYAEYQFRRGYAAFNQKQYDKALESFNQIDSTSPLYEDAQYFSGHIKFVQGQNEEAKAIFQSLAQSEKYKDKVSPYLLQTAYKTDDYQTAIEEGKKILAQPENANNPSEAQKLVGESLFNNKQYTEAIPYLEQYNSTATHLTSTDYYQLGYAYYQTGNYAKAVENYNKIVGGNDALAQTAYYQLGHSYVKTGQKQEALNAFKTASTLNFDANVKKDAAYNYAKISYEIGNNTESVQEALNNYLTAYPNDAKNQEIYGLLVSSYANLGDYSKAYNTLKTKIAANNPNLKDLQNKVGLKYGGQLYKEEKYTEAQTIFDEVQTNSTDLATKARALYWKAQTQYQSNNYSDALNTFSQVEKINAQFPEKENIAYNKAYSYYQQKNYKEAATEFKKYLQNTDANSFKQDAQLRLADSYYAAAQFANAQTEYQKVITLNHPQKDYAAFQIGMLSGLLDKNAQKVNQLDNFATLYPNSEYKDDAQYQLADAYFKSGNTSKALQEFDNVQKLYPKSELITLAELKKAQIYYNEKELDKALISYKKVALDADNVALKQEAVEGVKKIYTEQSNISAFESWTQTNAIQTDKDELTRLAFEVAEKQYEEKNYAKAITLFQGFNTKYPNSVNLNQSNYYIAESYYQTQNWAEAKKYFEKTKSQTAFQEQSYLRLAQLYDKEKNNDKVAENLSALEKITENTTYKNFAQTGLMRIYLAKNDITKAKPYADKVIADPLSNATAKEDAQLVLARSMATTEPDKAQQYYNELSKSGKKSIKAEALYYQSLNLRTQKKYEASNKIIFDMAANYADEGDWAPKALLTMADNYVSLKDPYQANYTLDMLIQNYTDYPELVKKAQEKKATIKK